MAGRKGSTQFSRRRRAWLSCQRRTASSIVRCDRRFRGLKPPTGGLIRARRDKSRFGSGNAGMVLSVKSAFEISATRGCRRGVRRGVPGACRHRYHVVARDVGRTRAAAGEARRRFQRIAIRIPDRAELQGQLYRNRDRGDLCVSLAQPARHRSGQRNRDRDHDGGEGRDLSGVRIDAGRSRRHFLRRRIFRPSPATTPTSPATCCRSRSMPRRRSCTTTRTCSAPPASIPKWRRRPGRKSARRQSGCARPAPACGLTTSWPSWINVENFSALHNLPISTKANGFGGLDAVLNFNNPLVVRHIAQLAEWQTSQGVRLQRPRHLGGAAVSKRRMRNLHRLVGDARRHQGQFEIRGRLRHAAVLARRRGRAAKLHHRRRHLVGAARPAARRIQGRRQVLRVPVEAGSSGRLASEHRLSAGDARGLRSDPRAGLLRSQSRRRDLDRADHAEAADRKFARASGSDRSC